ncbi:Uncharacterized conserved protein UCP015417, vWA [Quillaja saponaria]|uniref:Uncharacterized conserved protein UCP015417, vWA n=1 Tax=Quillaja saponaria TaxID=32244 RepID=A0AAD7LBL3_QUISA|nr:Uncharacterized conserved protein UCP015417, vWA [Quillaja saponaria]
MDYAMKLIGPPLAGMDTGKPIVDPARNCSVDCIISQTSNLQLTGNPPKGSTHETTNDAMLSDINNLNLSGKPPMGLTENLSPTFLSSGNPCLDFLFHVVPDTPSDDLIQRLQLSWAYDPLLTLKLICNLRGVRGTGKSDKEGFYTAALWLHSNHPKTLALNIRAIADFGYLKDLPEILYRLLQGPDVRRVAKAEWRNRQRGKKSSNKMSSGKFKRGSKRKCEVSGKEKEGILENVEEVGNVVDKEMARKLRKEKEIARARIALERYTNDLSYRLLYDCISNVFAELLKSDIGFLNSGEVYKISLAAKWCPSIDSSFDKTTLICEGIAKRVFPRNSDPDYEGLEEAHYVYRVRDRLRKQVLVPLHKALNLPEVYMSANRWQSLPYARVASVAMKNYKELFKKHDKERFDDYLEKVKSGKAKIAAGALLPHEIISSLNDEDGGKVAELQWERIVEDLSNKGKLSNCVAICDVSGSMDGTPMEVCVALGLLVSELSEEPWKGKVVTFSADPQLHVIEGDTLLSKTKFIRKMDWGSNTDLQKVFDRILEVAVEGKLGEDQMIKRLFIFSDMEFDQASGLQWKYHPSNFSVSSSEEGEQTEEFDLKIGWETDYEVIQRKFKEHGYNKVPEIVFWNLRNSSSTPVVSTQKGVALVHGV